MDENHLVRVKTVEHNGIESPGGLHASQYGGCNGWIAARQDKAGPD